MADFVTPAYSKRLIIDAGKALRGTMSYSPEAVEIFRIVHNWRASHLLPMRHMRSELVGKARSVGGVPITAARLKRMSSIRKKLRTAPHTLYQMQDIGGCRVIFDSIDDLLRLRAIYSSDANHIFRTANDYIEEPKNDGYRGCHLVYRYHGQGAYAGLNASPLLIELQLRTKLQHVWATAVEAVGMVRNEDLKGGSGHSDWLRLFALMSSEFAAEEECDLVPDTPAEKSIRREELLCLVQRLDAINTLNAYRNAIRFTADRGSPISGIYIIQFDRRANNLLISAVPRGSGAEWYGDAEKSSGSNTVLVEVDKAEDLVRAYPNYFLDVSEFAQRLRRTLGMDADGAPAARPDLSEWWKWKEHRRSVANYMRSGPSGGRAGNRI